MKPIVVVALGTGLRISNIIDLTWKQVDMSSRTICLEKTKNKKPVSIPMLDSVYETLVGLRQGSHVSLVRVFTKPSGESYNRHEVSRAFKAVCLGLGMKDMNFHGLRHTFCSWLAIEGANPADIASLAGHADLQTTMRYSHLNHERKKEVIKRLEPAKGPVPNYGQANGWAALAKQAIRDWLQFGYSWKQLVLGRIL